VTIPFSEGCVFVQGSQGSFRIESKASPIGAETYEVLGAGGKGRQRRRGAMLGNGNAMTRGIEDGLVAITGASSGPGEAAAGRRREET
jgi:hypothetical protein